MERKNWKIATTIVVLLAILAMAGSANAAKISVDDHNVDPGEEKTVPINVSTTGNFGTATIELYYNETLLDVESVSSGDIPSSQMEFNDETGMVKIAVRTSNETVSGTYTFAELTFSSVDSEKLEDLGYRESPLGISILEFAKSDGDSFDYQNANNGTLTINDTTEPLVEIISPVEGYYKEDFTVNVSATDALTSVNTVTFGYAQPGENFTWVVNDWSQNEEYRTHNFAVNNVDDGEYTIKINATDSADNSNKSVSVSNVVVDTEVPVVDFISPADTWYNSNIGINVSVNDTSIDSVKYGWAPDGEGYSNWTTLTQSGEYWTDSFDVTNLSNGKYWIGINATDKAGSSTTDGKSIMLDKEEPEVTIEDSEGYYTDSYTLKAKVFDNDGTSSGVAQVNYTVFNETGQIASGATGYKDWNWPYQATIDVSNWTSGNYDVYVNASDNAGNWNNSMSVEIKVDTSGPQIDILSPSTGWYSSIDEVKANVEDFSGVANVEYAIWGSGWGWNSMELQNNYINASALSDLEEGNYTIKVQATDNATNSNTANVTNVGIDKTEPVIELSTPTAEDPVVAEGNFWVNFSCTENNPKSYTIDVYKDGNSVTSDSGDYPLDDGDFMFNASELETASYNVTVSVTDKAGNSKTVTETNALSKNKGAYIGDYTVDELGGTKTVPIRIKNMPDFGFADIELSYNQNITVEDVSAGDIGMPNFEIGEGTVTLSASGNPSEDTFVFANLTIKSASSQPASSPLDLTVMSIGDTEANSLPAAAKDGSFTFKGEPSAFSIGDVKIPDDTSKTVSIDLSTPDVELGKATIKLHYDSSVVTVSNVVEGDIGSVSSNIYNGPGVTVITVDTSDVTGDHKFANVTLEATGTPGSTALGLSVEKFVDDAGKTVPPSLVEVDNGTFESGLRGDATNDGVVNGGDAMFISQYVVGNREDLPGFEFSDYSGDGSVTNVDAMLIAQDIVNGEL